MKSVTVRQAKYLVDRWNSGNLPRMYREYSDIVENIIKQIIGDDFAGTSGNALYTKIGEQIEEEAKRLVKELTPKTDEVVKKINKLNEEYAEINKKKTEKNGKKIEKELEEKQKELDEAVGEYDKLYKDTQKALDDYKLKVITEDNRGVAIMDIHDKEYNVIDFFFHWTIPDDKKDITKKYETSVEDVASNNEEK